MRLSFPLPLCGKNGQKISENILEYNKSFLNAFLFSEMILNMIKVTGGLSKNVHPVVLDN